MKYFIFTLFLALAIFGCEKEPSGIGLSEQIKLSTDKSSYSKTDSIQLFLENNSDSDIMIGLRCGEYLEMAYQMKENDNWSADKHFWYMQLGCMTVPDTIQANSTFNYSMPAVFFDTTGIFRLLVPCYVFDIDSNMLVISNSFEVN